MGDLGGEEGTSDLGAMSENEPEPNNSQNLMENTPNKKSKALINEHLNKMVDEYMHGVLGIESNKVCKVENLNGKFINSEFKNAINELEKFSENKTELDNLLD